MAENKIKNSVKYRRVTLQYDGRKTTFKSLLLNIRETLSVLEKDVAGNNDSGSNDLELLVNHIAIIVQDEDPCTNTILFQVELKRTQHARLESISGRH